MTAQSDYLALYGGDYGTWTDIAATRQEPPTMSMHFTIERSALLAAVKLARVAVATKTPMPILEHFLLDATPDGGLVVTATDFAIALAATAPAVVKTPGRATIPAQLAVAMLAQCAAPTLTVTLDKGKVRMVGTGTKLALPSLDPKDYPADAFAGAATPLADCDAATFRAAVARVAFAAGEYGGNPALSGVRLEFGPESLTIAAMDGYRLAATALPVHRPEGAEDCAVTIPARSLTGVLGALSDGHLTIGRAGNMVAFATGTATAHARTIDGSFPDLHRRTPTLFPVVARVPRDELREAARLVALVGNAVGAVGTNKGGNFIRLELTIGPDELIASGGIESQAEVAIPLLTPLPATTRLALDAGAVVESLGALAGESVRLCSGGGPIFYLLPDGDGPPATTQGIAPMIGENAGVS